MPGDDKDTSLTRNVAAHDIGLIPREFVINEAIVGKNRQTG
jgi:hypothetical protein